MVKNAEKYLDKKITKLVITVQAYFNDSQRKLTKQAAELLGLEVLRIINEPTAAALSYGFDTKENKKEKILIFDLGGGTFDVTILDLSISLDKEEKGENYKSFNILSTSGESHLGGEDFDNKLVEFVLKKVIDDKGKLMQNQDEAENWKKALKEEVMKDKQAIKRLKVSCENIKKILSKAESAILRINNFYQNEDTSEKITREEFEKECEPLFNKLKISIDDALKSANLKAEDINQVILVGGSTRIPKVKEIVKSFFPKCNNINDKINPDEAVAYGATIDAEKILHNKDNKISNLRLMGITPFSLGTNIENYDNDEGQIMSVIIKRGTPIPTYGEKPYYSAENNQTGMSIDI